MSKDVSTMTIHQVPLETKKKLKIKAAQDDKSMQDILLELIDKYVEEEEGKEKEK